MERDFWTNVWTGFSFQSQQRAEYFLLFLLTRAQGQIFSLVFLNSANLGLFFVFSVFSNKQYNFSNKSMWKKFHSLYSTGVRTHNLSNMSCLP